MTDDQWFRGMSEATGHLASSIAWFLNSGDRKGLEADYKKFLRSPVCTPELKATLPTITKGRR